MNRIAAPALLALIALAAAPAWAEVECASPMGDWQPIAKLVAQVTDLGWSVQKARADDGCYHLRATDKDGKTVEAVFDPVTLQQLAAGPDEHDDKGDHEKADPEKPAN